MGGALRGILVVATLGLLASDLAQDAAFFQIPVNRTLPLLGSMAVRNLLMLAAAGALLTKHRAAGYLLGLCAVLGLVRRGAFLGPVLGTLDWTNPALMAFHSGADLLFRLVLLGVAIDWLRREKA